MTGAEEREIDRRAALADYRGPAIREVRENARNRMRLAFFEGFTGREPSPTLVRPMALPVSAR